MSREVTDDGIMPLSENRRIFRTQTLSLFLRTIRIKKKTSTYTYRLVYFFLDNRRRVVYLPVGKIGKGRSIMTIDGYPVMSESRTVRGKRPRKRKGATLQPEASEAKPEGHIREELMKAALDLFTQRGYSATTVRELVEAAGVTKPVLYYYFASKEGLFLELMRTHFGRLEAVVDVYRKGEGSVRKRLTSMLDKGFVYIQQDRDFIRLMHAVYYGPPGEAPYFDFDAYHQRYHDLIAKFLKEGIERGEFRFGNAGDMAWIILGTMEIAIEDQICCQASRIDRNTLKRLLNLVFDGLAADNDKRKGKNV
jgi:TetR/AcrR family transcriptional regulator